MHALTLTINYLCVFLLLRLLLLSIILSFVKWIGNYRLRCVDCTCICATPRTHTLSFACNFVADAVNVIVITSPYAMTTLVSPATCIADWSTNSALEWYCNYSLMTMSVRIWCRLEAQCNCALLYHWVAWLISNSTITMSFGHLLTHGLPASLFTVVVINPISSVSVVVTDTHVSSMHHPNGLSSNCAYCEHKHS